jgi:hypothetical protein
MPKIINLVRESKREFCDNFLLRISRAVEKKLRSIILWP